MSLSKISKIINIGSQWEEYFENPSKDYFNPQKIEINLINSSKSGSYLRHVPDNYSYPNSYGYALIRGLNCQARCTYCYLQTYYKSPDMIRFGNTNDYIVFLEEFIVKFKEKYGDNQKLVFFDGDFQDSLGYVGLKENINQINEIVSLLEKFNNVYLEIRTKCILNNNNFALYHDLKISDKLIVAITFSPQDNIDLYEPGTTDLNTRIDFAKYIINRGGFIGPRIDPIILDNNDWNQSLNKYLILIDLLKENINDSYIYNWSIGILRIKDNLYKRLKLNSISIVNNLILEDGFWKYDKIIREDVYDKVKTKINSDNFFVCMDTF